MNNPLTQMRLQLLLVAGALACACLPALHERGLYLVPVVLGQMAMRRYLGHPSKLIVQRFAWLHLWGCAAVIGTQGGWGLGLLAGLGLSAAEVLWQPTPQAWRAN